MRFCPANIAVHKSIIGLLRHRMQPPPLSFTTHIWSVNKNIGGPARRAGYQVKIRCLFRHLKYVGEMNFTSCHLKLSWKVNIPSWREQSGAAAPLAAARFQTRAHCRS